jgi:hypothetical protein
LIDFDVSQNFSPNAPSRSLPKAAGLSILISG